MSDQDNGQVSTLQRPISDDPEAWRVYWKAQGWSWRTEPEIDALRQKFLAERRAIVPDIKQGIYPFKDIKLSRADVEWLLVTHNNGRGTVSWSDARQWKYEGIDLRGADLCKLNLNRLPLMCLQCGLDWDEWNDANPEQREAAVTHLEGADLNFAHLENAILRGTHLEKAHLYGAHLEGAFLYTAHLEGANLEQSFFDSATQLGRIFLGTREVGVISLVDVNWSDVNVTVVNWTEVTVLGDELKAIQAKEKDGSIKDQQRRLSDYHTAVRANRQLVIVLQSQGLNEDASRFAYRAQRCQRVVLRLQKKFGQYLFSGFLDLLAGYGYRPGRSVLWYLAAILVFALAYHFLGGLTLYPPDAFVFSIMSFHGRGFFPALSQETNLHNPLVMLAALEAIIGLLIEISFIATFTQRFFGR